MVPLGRILAEKRYGTSLHRGKGEGTTIFVFCHQNRKIPSITHAE